jgi:hypothetical protein
VGKKTRTPGSEQLDELRDLAAESNGDGNGAQPKKTDRRAMLKLAGAAVLGAAGMAAVKVMPASAASGGNFILGAGNLASSDTVLTASGTGTIGLFVDAPQGGFFGGTAGGTGELGVLGASKNGAGIGVQGQSTSGSGVQGTVTTGKGVEGIATGGTGVLGSAGAGGIGVDGAASDNRGGLFTSTTGYDVALGFPVAGGMVGSGRLGMVGRLDVGAAAPNIAPAFAVTSLGGNPTFEHEFVRGNDSSIWASRFSGSGTNQSRWKRINAVRVDSSDGLGSPFKPKRVIDTRSGARKAAGTTNVVVVAPSGTGTSTIPADAVAIIGNLTAVNYTGPGFLAIMPAGVAYNPLTDPSSVNFIVGQVAIANSFVVGLGTGANLGKVQVVVAGHASHFIIDVTGYMQ